MVFTYERELEPRRWHRPLLLRVVLLLLGLLVTLSGWLMWTLEQEKGGWEESGLGHFVVGHDVQTGRAVVWGEDGEILYEADTAEDVDAWIESRRSRDFTIPVLVVAFGVVLVVLGVAPSPRRDSEGTTGADGPVLAASRRAG